MRAITLIVLSALAGLWGYYAVEVSQHDTSRPDLVAVETTNQSDKTSASSLNNTGVMLDRQGRHADALAHFQRAHSFRPDDPAIFANYRRQKARVVRMGWWRALLIGSTLVGVFVVGGGIWRITRGAMDHVRLARLRLAGKRIVRIDPSDKEAELAIRFNHPVRGLCRRHKPNVVWTCAEQNQHMKSRRSVKVSGRECRVRLDKKKLKQLRRYPGHWRCILRLGDTEVGEAAAKVV